MESKTKEELKEIALGLVHGTIFCDRHVPESDSGMLGSIFMPLMFLDEDQRDELDLDSVGLVYERMDKAGPRSINGYPMFMSFGLLNKEDSETVFEIYERLVDAEKAALED